MPTPSRSPLRLHPDNPRWFHWRGRARALVTSAEHYGAVVNLDFDFHRYLETLQREGMNYTRVFTGAYIEPQGAFGISRNTLAPASGRFLAPWARSRRGGYAGGGNRFDLEKFSPAYFARLKAFIAEAARRDIVVELTLFSAIYGEAQWAVNPFNPANNVQGFAVPDWRSLNTLPASGPGARLGATPVGVYQENLVRWLVRELNGCDNLFFEIANEPWATRNAMGDFINPYLMDKHAFPNAVEITAPASVAWQRAIASVIRDEESRLPHRHLVAQNVANFRLALTAADLVPEADVVHFHYALPEAVDWNRGLPRAIGDDETGFAGAADATYRRQAWEFLLGGGAVFNNLDYSFSVGHEDGTDRGNEAPGGGGPALRRQLKVLGDFLHGFALERLNPDPVFVRHAPGVVARVLSDPGAAYAVYLHGRGPAVLDVDLPAGRWLAEWIAVETGSVKKKARLAGTGAEPVRLPSPAFAEEIALKITRGD
jgi:hypothetical protein